MKRQLTSIIIIMLLITIPYIYISQSSKKASYVTMQKDIATKIIRFHVKGNSNSKYDQSLKLKVKEHVVSKMEPLLHNVTSITDARAIITNNLTYINNIATSVLKQNNSPYKATTSLKIASFPTKRYGDMTLPKGEYESVCIDLGDAKGKNWWCMLYPSLCFVDCTYSVLPPESKDKLKHSLTSEEYNYIMNSPNAKVYYESALFNLIKNIFNP